MKRLLSVFLAIVMLFAIVACGSSESAESNSSDVSVSDVSDVGMISVPEKVEKTFGMGVVNGAPALAVANLTGGFDFSDETSDIKTEVKVEKDAPGVIAGLTNGTYDMAILPLNIAAKLYNANQLGIKLVSVNIFSVLYVISKGDYSSLDDLKGKVVYSIGAGGTPEIVFKNILKENNIGFEDGTKVNDAEKVYFNAVTEASNVIAALNKGEADFALLGEPVVTQAMAKTGAKIAFALEDEWKKIHSDIGFVQAGLIIKEGVLAENAYLDALLNKMAENKEYLTANAEKAVEDLKSIGATLPTLSTETLERCNIGADGARNRKADIEAFLSVLNPGDYGGQLPDDGFYAK